MIRRNSKANDWHIYTPSCINLFVSPAGTLSIYQNATYTINLTLIFQIVTNKHMTLPLLQSWGQKRDYLGIPRAKAVTANHLVPMPNLFQRACVSQSLTLPQALSDSQAQHWRDHFITTGLLYHLSQIMSRYCVFPKILLTHERNCSF